MRIFPLACSIFLDAASRLCIVYVRKHPVLNGIERISRRGHNTVDFVRIS